MNTFIIREVICIPKIIDGLRPRLLAEARRMLLTGEKGLTIRAVASSCQVASGTVYNYFRSKDELLAHVILADWQEALAAMRIAAEGAPDVLTGLKSIHENLTAFCKTYREVWHQYAGATHAAGYIEQRHPLLVGQLAQIISALLSRHGALWTQALPAFLAESLLTSAVHGDPGFDQLSPILTRLIQPS